MRGLMQDWPMRIHRFIDHAALYHPGARIVCRTVEGDSGAADSNRASGSPPWPGTPIAISKPGTASQARARSITP
jgi:hypothetical protein